MKAIAYVLLFCSVYTGIQAFYTCSSFFGTGGAYKTKEECQKSCKGGACKEGGYFSCRTGKFDKGKDLPTITYTGDFQTEEECNKTCDGKCFVSIKK
ncbi:hypothetical protein H0W26_04570 [Candidatus Dependentiae bacterium]|nr:hypothetical protein [Candidatus Dependentiae bacterium]